MSDTIYSSSLADCKKFAKLFSNTCSDNVAASNIIFLTGKTIKCDNTGPNCVDAGSRVADSTACSYDRKLCVSCTQVGGDKGPVWIRVQSNGLPESCFWGFKEVKEQAIDMTVAWNQPVEKDK